MLRRTIHLAPLLVFACCVAQAEPASISLEAHPAGTYYLSGAIDGAGEMDFLLDTGSSYLVLGDGMLRKLEAEGLVKPGRELEGRMADGSRRVIPTYRISALRIGDACWIHDVEVVSFEGNSRAILGMNVLAELAPFTFSTHPPELGIDLDRCSSALPPAIAATGMH